MSITDKRSDEHPLQSIRTTGVETPLGRIGVYRGDQAIEFAYSAKLHTFRNGLSASIHRISIDTLNYCRNDIFEVRVGEIDRFEYYDSDEHTVMLEFHDEKHCIAMIGYDTYYDLAFGDLHERHERKLIYGSRCTPNGMRYTVVESPEYYRDVPCEHIIDTQIVCLPLSDDCDAAELIDMELI